MAKTLSVYLNNSEEAQLKEICRKLRLTDSQAVKKALDKINGDTEEPETPSEPRLTVEEKQITFLRD